jgi:hypothetical protein
MGHRHYIPAASQMTKTEGLAISPLAAELARLITLSKVKRILVEELFDRAGRFDPGLVGDPAARQRFLDALDQLQSAGCISLPTAQSRTGWDARALPPMPIWVTRVDSVSPAPRFKPAQRVWPSALEAAGLIASRADEHELLERIAAWMRDDPTPDLVPVQERSLELFDDEKAIDGYLKTRLFTSGGLTLDLLACFIPPVPFASQHLNGSGPPRLLVVENLATYISFLDVLRQHDHGVGPNLHIGWGDGAAFTRSILSVAMLDPVPERMYYFGDLDLAGLQIAVNAAKQAKAAGLPELCPAGTCYRFLLNGPQRWRRPDASNRHSKPDYDAACCWLPEDLRTNGKDLLQKRQRLPQERLGARALRQNPQVWEELC